MLIWVYLVGLLASMVGSGAWIGYRWKTERSYADGPGDLAFQCFVASMMCVVWPVTMPMALGVALAFAFNRKKKGQ